MILYYLLGRNILKITCILSLNRLNKKNQYKWKINHNTSSNDHLFLFIESKQSIDTDKYSFKANKQKMKNDHSSVSTSEERQ